MRSFRDKVAVVTGAAKGIGGAIAERLIAEQMQVMLADVDEPALARTAEHLRGRGGRVASAVTDVADVADAGSVQDWRGSPVTRLDRVICCVITQDCLGR